MHASFLLTPSSPCVASLLPAPQMEKTEKTIAEMEIDANLAHEFDKITEAGAQLQPLSGPG